MASEEKDLSEEKNLKERIKLSKQLDEHLKSKVKIKTTSCSTQQMPKSYTCERKLKP